MIDALAPIAETIGRDGFAFVHAPEMHAALETAGLRDLSTFADSWNDLGVDTYMADGGRYRRRRFAAFRASPSGITRKPHQPHYQSRDYNPLNGGIERWFEPVTDGAGQHPALIAILEICHALFDRMTPTAVRPPAWHVELHQFRIEARPGEAGQPTPEGMHRDGVDWVLVLMVRRENVASGETTIYDLQKRPLGSFTLTEPLDSAVVDDSRVYHGVTPVTPLDSRFSAYRDVLVVTFRRE
ncbi:MAG: 2OG-Fe dioxygenase family protein [Alphaproteobacteria bacterium]|nr:2OG-Fe dioxygenase family protein [Alphaproteobacteria bacterium]